MSFFWSWTSLLQLPKNTSVTVGLKSLDINDYVVVEKFEKKETLGDLKKKIDMF